MTLNSITNLKNIVILITSLTIVSCCSSNHLFNDNVDVTFSKEENILNAVKKSVVKITTITELTIIDTTTTTTISKEISVYSGSGSIIKQTTTGTFILTASHICEVSGLKRIMLYFPYYKPEQHTIRTKSEYLIQDIDGIKHAATNISTIEESDTCILLSTKIPKQPLKISETAPRQSQRAYTLGFPTGLWEINFVPVFSGFYTGTIDLGINSKDINAFYTIPASPGISGGPVININGEVIGIIHSYLSNFNDISFGATIDQVRQIFDLAESNYFSDKQFYDSLCLELDKSLYPKN